ncbi:MAG TPA: lysophospholipid transporter LplT, partial [Albitalea sp.]|nr:lysophospholipid transporter LplT [Albitalea sp.]
GASANLRYLVLAWAGAALAYDTPRATVLLLLVGLGTAAGAMVASMTVRLVHATQVILLGAALGAAVIAINGMHSVWVAGPFLIVLGAIGGFFVVPMNALLQHRGANLMGAGRSIAVQNFNEQASILGLGAFYTGMTKFGLSAFGAITIFGLVVAFIMWLIGRRHESNCTQHRDELSHLLALARSDKH